MKPERIFSNPFYCINISPELTADHTPLVTEEAWIKANTHLIQTIGAEKWLKELLENLRGNFQ